MRTMEQKAADLASKIDRDVRKAAGRGLDAARFFIEARVKEAARVKAPTRKVYPRNGGQPYLVATTKATPGAPLRVVSGRFAGSITSQMVSTTEALVGASAHAPRAFGRAYSIMASMSGVVQQPGFGYPEYWEVTNPVHQTFTPTLITYSDQMGIIVGRAVKAELA